MRLPIDYNVLEDEDGNIIENGYAHINDCITWCRKYGLSLILDLHKTKGGSFDNNPEDNIMFENHELWSRFISLWKKLDFGLSDEHYASCIDKIIQYL